MSKKKNVSKKKPNNNCALRNRRINQAGGSQTVESIIRNNLGIKDNPNVSVLAELLKRVEPRWTAEAHKKLGDKYTPKQIDAIVNLIVMEAKNALVLNKPNPTILASENETIRDDFIRTITKKDGAEEAATVADNISAATKELTLVNREANALNTNVSRPISEAEDKIVELTEAEYRALEGKLENVTGETFRNIEAVENKLTDVLSKLKIPDVTGDGDNNQLICSEGVFNPVNKLSLVVPETREAAPLDQCLTGFKQELNAAKNTIIEDRKTLMITNGGIGDAIPMFAPPPPPPPPPPHQPSSTPLDARDSSSHDTQNSLIVKRATLDHLSEIIGGQMIILSKWIKSLATSGLHKFKSALKTLFSSVLGLLEDTFPLLTLIGKILLQNFVRIMTSYAKSCGCVIKKVCESVSDGFSAVLTYDIATKPSSMSDDEFSKLCDEYNKANGNNNYFSIVGNKIVCKLLVMNATNSFKNDVQPAAAAMAKGVAAAARAIGTGAAAAASAIGTGIATAASATRNGARAAFDFFCEHMKTFGIGIANMTSSGMSKLFLLLIDAKEKFTKIMTVFINNHLSKENMAILYAGSVKFFSGIGDNVTKARNDFIQAYHDDNSGYIATCKDTAVTAVKTVKDALKNSSDYALFNVILFGDKSGKYTLSSTIRIHSFNAGILTQQGYIKSLESTNSILISKYADLQRENAALLDELYNNPLMRTQKDVDAFIDKIFVAGESSLVTEAKKQKLFINSHLSSQNAFTLREMFESFILGTQKSKEMQEIYTRYKDQKKDPHGDLFRLLGMLWDLDAIESKINPPKVSKTETMGGYISLLMQPFLYPAKSLLESVSHVLQKPKQTVKIDKCDSIQESSRDNGIIAKYLPALPRFNSEVAKNIAKNLLMAGIAAAQIYLIMKTYNNSKGAQSIKDLPVGAASNSKSAQPIKDHTTAAALGIYYLASQAVAWFMKRRKETFPMCIILECENATKVNLPLNMMDNVSTIFLEFKKVANQQVAIVRGETWLNDFDKILDDQERTKILTTIQILKKAILDSICSSVDYYSRRSGIFMDEAFGNNMNEIRKVYSGQSNAELGDVLTVSDNASFKIEYRFWMLLKGLQIKVTKHKSTSQSRISTFDTINPPEEYLSKVNEKYHNNQNARIQTVLDLVAVQANMNKSAKQNADELKTHVITGLITRLKETLGNREDSEITDFIAILENYIKGLESIAAEDKTELSRLETSANELLSKKITEFNDETAKQQKSLTEMVEGLSSLNTKLSESAAAAQAAIDAEKAAAQAKIDAEIAARVAAESKLKEAQKQVKNELINRILNRIEQSNSMLNLMLADLHKTAKDFKSSHQSGIEQFRIFDEAFYIKLSAFMELAGQANTDNADYVALDKLDNITHSIANGASLIGAFADTIGISDPEIGHVGFRSVRDSTTLTIRDVIESMKRPLETCKQYFVVLKTLIATQGDQDVLSLLSRPEYSVDAENAQRIARLATSNGGSKRKNRLSHNSRRKRNRINVYATKKINYLRRNNKIKMSVNRRRLKYRK